MTTPRKSASPNVRRALGERMADAMFGLSADFPTVVEVELAQIQPNPHQPRQTIDEAALAELTASIEQHGLLQPVVIRALDDQPQRYLLVAGQRRFLAHQRLGRATIFALVTTGEPDELALIENLQRADLDPLEEAEALARLQRSHGYTQGQLGGIIGRKQSTVSEVLSLVDLPQAIKDGYRTSDSPIAKSVLIELARIPDPDRQLALWEQVRRGGTIRQLRARKAGDEAPGPDRAKRVISSGRRFLRKLEQLPAEAILADGEQYQELARLHARFAELMATYTEASADPQNRPADTADG